jgi:hypothetical protein
LAEIDGELTEFYKKAEDILTRTEAEVVNPRKRNSKVSKKPVERVSMNYPQLDSLLNWERSNFVFNELLPKKIHDGDQKYNNLEKLAITQVVFLGHSDHLFRFNFSVNDLPPLDRKYFQEKVSYYQNLLSINTFTKTDVITLSRQHSKLIKRADQPV